MKKIYLLLLLVLPLSITSAQAQLGDWFKRKKEELAQKAKDKADQRINTSADNLLNKTDSVKIGFGKNKKKKQTKDTTELAYEETDNNDLQTGATVQPSNPTSAIENSNDAKCILATNIRSLAAKEKMENKLKELNGIYSINIDIRTGQLSIDYDKDESTYKNILKTISKAGFKAEKQ
ncbi:MULTISPECIES: heavy-metal-associated domain-containing protein [Chitinophagaceae]